MSKLRKASKGQQCQIRIPGVCNHDPATVVLCHINGAGTALKHDDTEAAFGCFNCHSAVDGKPVVKHSFTPEQIKLMHYEGCLRTREIFRKTGLIDEYK